MNYQDLRVLTYKETRPTTVQLTKEEEKDLEKLVEVEADIGFTENK